MQEITTVPNWSKILPAALKGDPPFQQAGPTNNYLIGVVDGIVVEVAIAVRTPPHPNFALRWHDFHYLTTSAWTSEADVYFVVAADVSASGERAYAGSVTFQEIVGKLRDPIPLKGEEYYILPASLFAFDDIL
jgi:hypothetical protein